MNGMFYHNSFISLFLPFFNDNYWPLSHSLFSMDEWVCGNSNGPLTTYFSDSGLYCRQTLNCHAPVRIEDRGRERITNQQMRARIIIQTNTQATLFVHTHTHTHTSTHLFIILSFAFLFLSLSPFC